MRAFGYTLEDLDMLIAPMARDGQEPVGSMGTDTPVAVLSNQPKLLFSYFKQLFAQVTNPPIDPIREEVVMSLVTFIGPKPNLLGIDETNPPLRLEASQPVLTADELAQLQNIAELTQNRYRSLVADITYPAASGTRGMGEAI